MSAIESFAPSALDDRQIISQTLSPLLSLPAELRNRIYRFVLVAENTVFDPSHVKSDVAHGPTPSINTALIRTCRQTYAEADLITLFSRNKFGFTSPHIARDFFGRLPKVQRRLVSDVEFDIKHVDDRIPDVAADWMRYLQCSTSQAVVNGFSLDQDVPNLQVLRLNFESWRFISTKKSHLWEMLRRMLKSVRGLRSVIVTGAGRGAWMEKQDPWSCVHYVGTDHAGQDDLVERMAASVGSPGEEDKVIVWNRADGKISLEVTTESNARHRHYLAQAYDDRKMLEPLPPNGCCTIEFYTMRGEMLGGSV